MGHFYDMTFFINIFLENDKFFSWFAKKSLFLQQSFVICMFLA